MMDHISRVRSICGTYSGRSLNLLYTKACLANLTKLLFDYLLWVSSNRRNKSCKEILWLAQKPQCGYSRKTADFCKSKIYHIPTKQPKPACFRTNLAEGQIFEMGKFPIPNVFFCFAYFKIFICSGLCRNT